VARRAPTLSVLDHPPAIELRQVPTASERVHLGADHVGLDQLPVGRVVGMELAHPQGRYQDAPAHPLGLFRAVGVEQGRRRLDGRHPPAASLSVPGAHRVGSG
jgi:hypothetical protein